MKSIIESHFFSFWAYSCSTIALRCSRNVSTLPPLYSSRIQHKCIIHYLVERNPSKFFYESKAVLELDNFSQKNVANIKKLFSDSRKRYAGIIIDVVFDYFLIRNWKRFTELEFDVFVDTVYRLMDKRTHIMPSQMQVVVNRMIDMDWFRSYGSLDTMG